MQLTFHRRNQLTRRILTALLAAIALAGAVQAAPAAAVGPSGCYQWDIGYWARFGQSNGYLVQFDFRQAAFRTLGGQARAWDKRCTRWA